MEIVRITLLAITAVHILISRVKKCRYNLDPEDEEKSVRAIAFLDTSTLVGVRLRREIRCVHRLGKLGDTSPSLVGEASPCRERSVRRPLALSPA